MSSYVFAGSPFGFDGGIILAIYARKSASLPTHFWSKPGPVSGLPNWPTRLTPWHPAQLAR